MVTTNSVIPRQLELLHPWKGGVNHSIYVVGSKAGSCNERTPDQRAHS
jgi:hypothetical protein